MARVTCASGSPQREDRLSLYTQDSEARCPGGKREKREKDACPFPCKNSVFNPVFSTKAESSLLKPTLLFKSLAH